MVLAERGEADVTDQHHLVVTLVEDRRQDVAGTLLESFEGFTVGPGDARGGVAKALALGIFPDGDEKLADGCLRPLGVKGSDRGRFRRARH